MPKQSDRDRDGTLIPAKWINVKTGKKIYVPRCSLRSESSDDWYLERSIRYSEDLKDYIVTQEFKEFMENIVKREKEQEKWFQFHKEIDYQRPRESVWVYIIGIVDRPIVKIGLASWPDHRLSTLQSASPDNLEFKMIIKCGIDGENYVSARKLEDKFKKMFEEWNRRGEWFDVPDNKVAEFYEKIIEVLDGVEVGGLNIYYENINFYDMYEMHSRAENKHSLRGSWKLVSYHC